MTSVAGQSQGEGHQDFIIIDERMTILSSSSVADWQCCPHIERVRLSLF